MSCGLLAISLGDNFLHASHPHASPAHFRAHTLQTEQMPLATTGNTNNSNSNTRKSETVPGTFALPATKQTPFKVIAIIGEQRLTDEVDYMEMSVRVEYDEPKASGTCRSRDLGTSVT